MSRRVRLLPLVLLSVVAAGSVGACGERASGETQAGESAAAKPAPAAGSPCPTVEQVGQAAGFEVTFTQAIGRSPDRLLVCQYQMTGRYRGNFIEILGEPASRADTVFAELRRGLKARLGASAELDRIEVGTQGWGFGTNSVSAAAAVIGPHVWQARLQYLMVGSIGDQKEAMIRVLKLLAH